MAEHTCIAAGSWNSEANRVCPACQEQHEKLYAKEREVLAAAVAFVDNDGHADTVNAIMMLGALVRVSREYSELCKQSPR